MRRHTLTWKSLIYYGEVFGFLLAWLFVFAAASRQSAETATQPTLDRVAAIGADNTIQAPEAVR